MHIVILTVIVVVVPLTRTPCPQRRRIVDLHDQVLALSPSPTVLTVMFMAPGFEYVQTWVSRKTRNWRLKVRMSSMS